MLELIYYAMLAGIVVVWLFVLWMLFGGWLPLALIASWVVFGYLDYRKHVRQLTNPKRFSSLP